MIRKFLNFCLSIYSVKLAEKKIEEKQQCLEQLIECRSELKEKLEEELYRLPKSSKKLIRLLKKEFERKKTIEAKLTSLFIVVSLLGVAFSFFLGVTKEIQDGLFLYLIGFIVIAQFLYLYLSVSFLLYILAEKNVVYEPLLYSLEELRKSVLLNRYQNIIRTNYLSAVYYNIKCFFCLLFIELIIYVIFLLKN